MKKNNQKGSTIIVCLIIMFFLSGLAILNFNSSKNDLRISNNINARNIKNQAAETGIQISISELFNDEDTINEVLQMTSSDSYTFCSSEGTIKKSNCENRYLNKNGTIQSESLTTLNDDTECLAYGNSDKKPYCYIIKGEGRIPLLNGNPSIHIQEVQINTININNNGIYEL